MKPYLFILPAFFLACCGRETKPASEKTYDLINSASWLLGKWENKADSSLSVEYWIRESDSSFAGESHFMEGADTVSSEKIRLVQDGGSLLYIPAVSNQNEGKPVSFKMTTTTDGVLVFENTEHDFPKKIAYRKISPDSIYAEISGTMNGEMRSIPFPFSRAE